MKRPEVLWSLPNDAGRCLGRGPVPWERTGGYLLALLHHSVTGQRLILSVFQNLCLERNGAVLFSSVARILKHIFSSWGKYFLVCVCNDIKREQSRIRFWMRLSGCAPGTSVLAVCSYFICIVGVVILPIAEAFVFCCYGQMYKDSLFCT